MVQPDRYEDQIRALEKYPVHQGKVLLYGSSFFAHWGYERAKMHWMQIGGLEIVNHGFGGATVQELLYYYDRMVKPYCPGAVVFRTGLNDVGSGLDAQQSIAQTRVLFDRIKEDFPGIPLVALQVFDTPWAADKNVAQFHSYNEKLKELASSDPAVQTVDLDPFFYRSSADIGTFRNFRDVFISDGLHLTDSGYERMAQYLIPEVKKRLRA